MRQCKQIQESVVFKGQHPAKLRYSSICSGTFTMETIPAGPIYEEGRDYTVNYQEGLICRTQDSRIPDWEKNVFFGCENFDHTKVDKYGNQEFTVFVSYEYLTDKEEELQTHLLQKLCPHLWEKLLSGEETTYVVYGDSISTGAESTMKEHTYFERFSQALREAVPGAKLTCINKALGGEDSRGGIKRLDESFRGLHPDLVTIGYGMNDQNLGDETPHFVEPGPFKENIRTMVHYLREHTQADICLVTPCLSNPKWRWTSGDADVYAEQLRSLAREEHLLLADATRCWHEELDSGKTPESLLHNNINHPNDYGHFVYSKALCIHI